MLCRRQSSTARDRSRRCPEVLPALRVEKFLPPRPSRDEDAIHGRRWKLSQRIPDRDAARRTNRGTSDWQLQDGQRRRILRIRRGNDRQRKRAYDSLFECALQRIGPDIAKCFNGLFDYGTSIEFDAENAISVNLSDLCCINTMFSRHFQHCIQRGWRNGNYRARSPLSKHSGFRRVTLFHSYLYAQDIAGPPS